ncbi:hypothetical protein BDQ17DRAFT_1214728, partial [Cyathus striatus]
LIQLCTGHIPLAEYLHRFKCMDTSRCKRCWEQLHVTTREMVHHYLFECPEYAEERHIMSRALGRKARDFGYLVSVEEGIRATLKYVGATK